MTIRVEREKKSIYWQQSLADELPVWRAELDAGSLNRREFSQRILSVLALAAIPSVSLSETTTKSVTTQWQDDPWHTLYEVQEHLFPHTDDAPGAKDISATAYLKRELPNPRITREEADHITNGVGWLNDLTQKKMSARFVDIDHDQRETILREIEKSAAGNRWIALLIYYTLEALLSDPVYGSNPDGIGWKWLDHNPGFPRPTPDKTYSKLGNV